jgi:hypothetical protein
MRWQPNSEFYFFVVCVPTADTSKIHRMKVVAKEFSALALRPLQKIRLKLKEFFTRPAQISRDALRERDGFQIDGQKSQAGNF